MSVPKSKSVGRKRLIALADYVGGWKHSGYVQSKFGAKEQARAAKRVAKKAGNADPQNDPTYTDYGGPSEGIK